MGVEHLNIASARQPFCDVFASRKSFVVYYVLYVFQL